MNNSKESLSAHYERFLPLFEKIDSMLKKGNVTIAIDGKSGSGKTYLSRILNGIYGCTVIHMDDFFLRPEQRTRERYSEIGGNIDYERFLEEILLPLGQGKHIDYRKFDCSTMKIDNAQRIYPTNLTVIEGVYSLHCKFQDYYNLSVFLDVSPSVQRERILKRNSPKLAERFFNEWIPLENLYFSEMKVKERSDIVIENNV